jgi:predicted signal transduction protein with EAL and GGDEF domain
VEGIETQKQLEIVEEMGGNEVQGFFLGLPTADPQMEIRLRQKSASPEVVANETNCHILSPRPNQEILR